MFRASEDPAATAVAGLIGKKYNSTEVNGVMKTVEKYRFLSTNFQYSMVDVRNCGGGQLDLVFFVLSLQLSPDVTLGYEARKNQNDDPEAAFANVEKRRSFQVSPQLGYNATDGVFAGGTVQMAFRHAGVPFDQFAIQGYGSSSLRWTDAHLSGQHDSDTSWLAHSEWASTFVSDSTPTTSASLNQGRLTAQFIGSSRPMKGAVVRFGAIAGGGNEQSDFDPSDLGPRVVPSSGYSGVKLLGGITGEGSRQAYSVSYGLEFGGSTSTSLLNDWRKQIGDVAYDFWLPFGDHRLFEVEQRFTVGAIDINRQIPVGELFFGGNSTTYFVNDEDWRIRSNPYIRSLTSNSFYHTSTGDGADNFYSYNLTAGFTVWRIPLMPPEIKASEALCKRLQAVGQVPPDMTLSQDFCKKLHGTMVTVTNSLQAVNAADDVRLKDVLAELPALQSKLNALSSAVADAQSSAPSSLEPIFQECNKAVAASTEQLKSSVNEKPNTAYELIEELLPDGEAPLSEVTSKCGKLNHSLDSPEVAAASNSLQEVAGRLQVQLDTIDNDASAKADSLMTYVKRLLFRVLSEVNIVSVSPVGLFDVAHIGPATSGPYSGTRYGVGAGLRLTLASTVSFTAAYAWNVDRHPGEGPGAFSFSLTTRNFFH